MILTSNPRSTVFPKGIHETISHQTQYLPARRTDRVRKDRVGVFVTQFSPAQRAGTRQPKATPWD
jgi:hypothetical protein